MSGSLQLHGGQPTRLSCPRDSPGKNIAVGCHFLLHTKYKALKKKTFSNLLHLTIGSKKTFFLTQKINKERHFDNHKRENLGGKKRPLINFQRIVPGQTFPLTLNESCPASYTSEKTLSFKKHVAFLDWG